MAEKNDSIKLQIYIFDYEKEIHSAVCVNIKDLDKSRIVSSMSDDELIKHFTAIYCDENGLDISKHYH
jgi:hypothetical protein